MYELTSWIRYVTYSILMGVPSEILPPCNKIDAPAPPLVVTKFSCNIFLNWHLPNYKIYLFIMVPVDIHCKDQLKCV